MIKNDRPSILDKYTEEEIIEFANQTKGCTEETGQCFCHELCPISHSTACCLHCNMSPHELASEEDKKYIRENFICKEPRCFRAIAVLFLGAKLEKSEMKRV